MKATFLKLISSNTSDLIDAAKALEKSYAAPQLLIGHSLGGCAAILAASQIQSVQAIASIAAPSSANHVAQLFTENREAIQKNGRANVRLGGAKFNIKAQFLDDLDSHSVTDTLRKTKLPFLVLHSPTDNIVGIENASELFGAAKHPKSFIALGQADHLLSDKHDATYCAEMIAAWSSRFLDHRRPARPEVSSNTVVVLNRREQRFTQDVYSENHHLVADEPIRLKGDDLGPTPYEFLLAALGSCTSMTMALYAKKKGIQLDRFKVTLSHERQHREDCEQENKNCLLDVVRKSVRIEGDFDEQTKKRILEIAGRCPVNLTLQNGVRIESL